MSTASSGTTSPTRRPSINALINGEIDMIDQPVIELLSLLEGDKNIKVADLNPLGAQIDFRFNTLHKPFDNPKIRQAVFYALNQKDFLVAGYTDPKFFKECKALFICGTPLATDKGFEDKLTSDFAKSKQILKEEGYDGTPVVLLYATDTNTGRLTPILKSLLERGGFIVDMQAMDWNTVVARRTRKEPPSAGGWQRLPDDLGVGRPARSRSCRPSWAPIARRRPSAGRATPSSRSCATPSPRPPTTARRKELATAIQVRMSEYPTHVQLGQFNVPSAIRASVTGNLEAPAPVFWNVRKKQ